MLKNLYKGNVINSLKSTLNYDNVMRVPKVQKICLNMGIGSSASDSKILKSCVSDLSLIAAQKAVVTYAKKSIAGFKIRKGYPLGCKVTLRNDRMYSFLERLLYIAFPRERDFKALSRSQLDGNGNCSMSIKEHISFLEIDYDKVDKIWGLDITVVTSAVNDHDAKMLLTELGFPFID